VDPRRENIVENIPVGKSGDCWLMAVSNGQMEVKTSPVQRYQLTLLGTGGC